MAFQLAHTKIINAVAREVLYPLGVRQKGRSRFWYDDAGWYTTFIEFQPSGWSRGSYLNTGVHWLWYPKDHWSFDLVDRDCGFAEFENKDQFRDAILPMAESAATFVRETRARFETLSGAFDYAKERSPPVDWYGLHLGILAALGGDTGMARSFASAAIIDGTTVSWQADRNRYVRSLLDAMDDPQRLRGFLENGISECRALLGLAESSGPRLPIR